MGNFLLIANFVLLTFAVTILAKATSLAQNDYDNCNVLVIDITCEDLACNQTKKCLDRTERTERSVLRHKRSKLNLLKRWFEKISNFIKRKFSVSSMPFHGSFNGSIHKETSLVFFLKTPPVETQQKEGGEAMPNGTMDKGQVSTAKPAAATQQKPGEVTTPSEKVDEEEIKPSSTTPNPERPTIPRYRL
jgi:hypothetical protein